MAKFGLSYPVVAKLDVTTGTYSGGKVTKKNPFTKVLHHFYIKFLYG